MRKLPIQNHLKLPITEKRQYQAKHLTRNPIRLKFVKKTSMPKLWYIKCYSSSNPRSIQNTSNSIRYSCQKVCNWSRKPETILEIKKGCFFLVINKPINYKFFKDFTTTERRLTGLQFLAVHLSTTFLNTGTTQQSGKQDSFRHILNEFT